MRTKPAPPAIKLKQKFPISPGDLDTYEITVVFQRSMVDDIDFARERVKKGTSPTLEMALIAQFCAELQQAYEDTGSLAGTFEVIAYDPHEARVEEE